MELQKMIHVSCSLDANYTRFAGVILRISCDALGVRKSIPYKRYEFEF